MFISLAALAAACLPTTASALQLDLHKGGQQRVRLEQRGHSEAPLIENALRSEYFINVSVGTPPQPLQLQFDTGSSDIWFPSVTADACSKSHCQLHGAFNASQSSTFHNHSDEPFVAGYGSGSAHGVEISDVLTIAGAELKNLTMGLAQRFTNPSPNGILGVGPDVLQSAAVLGTRSVVPGILDALFSLGVISRRAFSVYLDIQESGRGSVLFGGIDPSKYVAPLSTLALTKNASGVYDRYRVDLTAVTLVDADGLNMKLSPDNMSAPAVLDTGVTLLYLPEDIASSLAQGFGAVLIADNYLVDCEYRTSNATLAFQFGGVDGPVITVPADQLIGDPTGIVFDNRAPACLLNIASGQASEQLSPSLGGYSLGDPFIRSAYIVYDVENSQIHIAQAALNRTGDGAIQDIPAGSGLPMIASSIATAIATLLPTPTPAANSTAAAGTAASETGSGSGPSSTDATTGSVIPTTPPSPSFSLGVSVTAAAVASATSGPTSVSAAAPNNPCGQLVWIVLLVTLPGFL